MNLYDLTQEAESFRQAVEDGVTPEELETLIQLQADNKADYEAKVIAYGHVILGLRADQETIKAERKRLDDRQKHLENAEKRLRDALNDSFFVTGTDKVQSPTITVRRQKKPTRLEIIEIDAIPDKFWQTKREVCKSDINQWFKDTGEVVPGTEVRENEHFITIK